jgi:hypothetical protein
VDDPLQLAQHAVPHCAPGGAFGFSLHAVVRCQQSNTFKICGFIGHHDDDDNAATFLTDARERLGWVCWLVTAALPQR